MIDAKVDVLITADGKIRIYVDGGSSGTFLQLEDIEAAEKLVAVLNFQIARLRRSEECNTK